MKNNKAQRNDEKALFQLLNNVVIDRFVNGSFGIRVEDRLFFIFKEIH